MSSFFVALFLASATLCIGVPAQAQLPADSSPANFSSSTAITALAEYTGRVVYGDTGKPAAGIHVYFRKEESIDGRLPTAYVATTDAAGYFHLSRYDFSFSQNAFVWFQVDDPRNLYAAEVVQGSPTSEERLPGMDWMFPTLTQNGIVSDDPYPDGILRFVPMSAWQDKSSACITLETGTFVAGTVTDAATGRPLSGIPLYTRGPHNHEEYERAYDSSLADAYATITDNAGHYRLPVIPGKCTLAINHRSSYGGDDSHTIPFVAVHGKTSAADLALSPDEIARLQRESVEMQKRIVKVAMGIK